jgi:tubulin--tyrosine ligase-like protein 12
MDEFGSRIQHSDKEFNFRLVPFLSMLDGSGYSLLFPIKNVENGAEVTRDYLEGPEATNSETRQALLNIWSRVDMTSTDWKQVSLQFFFRKIR